MRILIGTTLKRTRSRYLLYTSLVLFIAGCTFLKIDGSIVFPALGITFLGAGLATGFPVMFGFVGARYTELSATAFGLVLSVAMSGSLLVNYIMAFLLEVYGARYLIIIIYCTILMMTFIAARILYRVKL